MTVQAIFTSNRAITSFLAIVGIANVLFLLYQLRRTFDRPVAAIQRVQPSAKTSLGTLELPEIATLLPQEKMFFWKDEQVFAGKLILFWTPYFADKEWRSRFKDMKGPFVAGSRNPSEKLRCFFTSNRSLIGEADAVVFHGRDLNYQDFPQERTPSQRWIIYNMEAPGHSGLIGTRQKPAESARFNWTMSYHRNSDVFVPYFYVTRRKSIASWWMPFRFGYDGDDGYDPVDDRIKMFTDDFTKRPKDAVWFVSECKVKSLRMELAELIRSYGISVDIFGRCSKIRPDGIMSKFGENIFYSRYRFYLSFENSLCDDYVTEKFARGLRLSTDYGIIPIVYGARLEDYERIAPKDSFVFAESFGNISDLTSYLQDLKTTKGMVASYYQWQKKYVVSEDAFPKYELQGTCKKLFLEDKTGCRANPTGDAVLQPCQPVHSSVSNITDKFGSCRVPSWVRRNQNLTVT